ncbi:MAG: hypothetical protein ACRC0N_07750 [Acinetobacter johnsonii]
MKNKIINGVLFLIAWGVIYWITSSNFWFISFLFAYIFVYSIGKDSLIFLANEFDKNHNALADNVRSLYDEIQFLKDENETFKEKILDLENQISSNK